MKIYISTPINGRKEKTPYERRKAAHRKAKALKAYLADEYPDADIVTPFDVVPFDDTDVTETEALGRDITALLECDTVFLDRGWTSSKGCNLEYRAAKIYGLRIIDGNNIEE